MRNYLPIDILTNRYYTNKNTNENNNTNEKKTMSRVHCIQSFRIVCESNAAMRVREKIMTRSKHEECELIKPMIEQCANAYGLKTRKRATSWARAHRILLYWLILWFAPRSIRNTNWPGRSARCWKLIFFCLLNFYLEFNRVAFFHHPSIHRSDHTCECICAFFYVYIAKAAERYQNDV